MLTSLRKSSELFRSSGPQSGHSRFRLVACLCTLALIACGTTRQASAATYDWTAAGGGDWNTGGNWTPVGPPPNGGHTVNINTPGNTITGNPAGGDDKWSFLNFDAGTIQDHDRANANNSGTWEFGDGLAGTAQFSFGGNGTFRGGTFNINSDGIVETTSGGSVTLGHISSNSNTNVNVLGGTLDVLGHLSWSRYSTSLTLNSGTVNIGLNAILAPANVSTSALNVSGGSFSAGVFTVNGWGADELFAMNITGSDASQIEFSQWDIDESNPGAGTLTYGLEAGETLTPISLTHATDVFGNNATNFNNGFTINFDGSGVDDTFDSELVLFELTQATDFDDVTQLNIMDNLGTSLRGDGDTISISTSSGDISYLLRFDALRVGNLDGDLEIWLQTPPVPEPSSFLLMAIGGAALVTRRRRRRR